MNKSVLTLAVLVAFLSLFIVGCGGGDSSVGIPQTTTQTGEGTIALNVDWPQIDKEYGFETKGLDGKYIYSSVNSIKVEVLDSAGTVKGSTVLSRPSGSTTTSGSITVQAGTYMVDCGGYTGTDGTGTLISHRRKGSVVVTANNATSVTAALGISILPGGSIKPTTTYCDPGTTLYWGNNDPNTTYTVLIKTNPEVTITVAPGAETPNTFTTGSSSSTGFQYNVYTGTSVSGTPVATGYVIVSQQTGGSYTYSSSLSKVVTPFVTTAGAIELKSNSSNVFAFYPATNVIEKYTLAGAYVDTYLLNGTTTVASSDFVVDNSGYMYVLAGGNGIAAYDPNGAYSTIYSIGTTAGYYSCMSIDSAGKLYAAGGASGANVIKYTKNTTTPVAIAVTSTSQISTKMGVDGTGNVYTTNGTVLTFYNTSGVTQTITHSGANTPSSYTDLSIYNKSLYVTRGAANEVYKGTITATPDQGATSCGIVWTRLHNSAGFGSDQLQNPSGIVGLDENNAYYVGDSFFGRIRKFAGSTVSLNWRFFGGFAASPTNAYGVNSDTSGNLYVADSANNRIVKFDSAGVFQNVYGYDTATSTSWVPTALAVAVDSSGSLYVTTGTSVEKFSSAGVRTNDANWPKTVSSPGSIIVSGDNVYVQGTYNSITGVHKFTTGGTVVNTGGYPVAIGFVANSGMAIDGSGNIYVVPSAAATTLSQINPRVTGEARQTPSGARPHRGALEGGPPELPGRSLEASGNCRPRVMIIAPRRVTEGGNRTRLTACSDTPMSGRSPEGQ